MRLVAQTPPLLEARLYGGILVTGTASALYTIEANTNAASTNGWVVLTNVVLPASPWLYIDRASAGISQRFYRARVKGSNAITLPDRVGLFSFPADESAHNLRSEYWYFNGHLTAKGELYSYDFMTVFFNYRYPRSLGNFRFLGTDNHWRRYFTYEKKFRPGEYTASADKLYLNYGDCYFYREGNGYRLKAGSYQDEVGVDLTLTPTKPPMLVGKGGYVAIAQEFAAYYAQTSLTADGFILLPDGQVKPVQGTVWLDRSWGNHDQSVVVWEWFSLQLNNQAELAVISLYDTASGVLRNTYINYLDAAGNSREGERFTVTPLGYWTSPQTGKRYSSGWDITSLDIAGGLSLRVMPKQPDQEFAGSNQFWEGSTTINGVIGGVQVAGEGYAELTKTY